MIASFAEHLRLMAAEGRRRVVALACTFAVIALAALAFGVSRPKQYEARALILVQEKNIITPLMQGRAVATGVSDAASLVSQAMQSRKILRELLAFGGWDPEDDPRAEERMLHRLSSRIRIWRQRPELIGVSYVDTDPTRCFAMTRKIADVYVREARLARSGESGAAFEFIERQVAEYATKVADAHAQVLAYYRDPRNQRALRAAEAVAAAAAAPAPAPRVSTAELTALLAEEAELVSRISAAESREARQRRADRIEQLQRELDVLLRTYTENHPNVRRVRDELEAAQASTAATSVVEQRAAESARARLSEVRTRIAAATEWQPRARAAAPQPTSADLLVSQDETLSDLLRRYESTREVYQDLLKRLENARVSVDLDAEQRDTTVRVFEEPELPRLPIGLRLRHVALAGLVLAVAVPLALLFALVRFDPRVRTAHQLERSGIAPLLVTIPYAPPPADRRRGRRRAFLAGGVVSAVFAAYAAVLASSLGLLR